MRWGRGRSPHCSRSRARRRAACGGGGGDTVDHHHAERVSAGIPARAARGLGRRRGDVAFRVEGDLFAVAENRRRDGRVAHGRRRLHVRRRRRRRGQRCSRSRRDRRRRAPVRGRRRGPDLGDRRQRQPPTPFAGRHAARQPITGLAFAPSGFGDFGGSLFAAAGDGGHLRVTMSDTPAGRPVRRTRRQLCRPRVLGHDAVRDRRQQRRDRHGEPERDDRRVRFRAASTAPVGIDRRHHRRPRSTSPMPATTCCTRCPSRAARRPHARAYDFDSAAPSGLAYDGLGAIAFITSGSARDPRRPTCRGSTPRSELRARFRRPYRRLRRSRVRPLGRVRARGERPGRSRRRATRSTTSCSAWRATQLGRGVARVGSRIAARGAARRRRRSDSSR